MRVVLNQQAALGQKTGIGHYTTELLRCLRTQAAPDQIEAFPEGWVKRARITCARARPYLEGHAPAGQAADNSGVPAPPFRKRLLGYARQLGRDLLAMHFRLVCRHREYDLYHEPNFIPLPCDRPTVVTLADLSVLLYPQWHPADRVAHFDKYFHKGLDRAVHFLAISDHSRQEIIRVLNLSPQRVTRTYMGIRPGLGPLPEMDVQATLRRLNLPPRYLLYLGTLEPRKNLLVLLRAYCALPASLRERWPLLLAGGWGWNTSELADYFHREARHRGVVHLGYVADEHVAAIYNGARALVFPSLYEGFGLPPIEMMACGGAVLASTAGALVETVGARAHLVDPEDLDGWIHGLKRVLQDDDWWRSLRQGVQDIARPYTWENCARVTLDVYRQVCEGRAQTQPLKACA